MAAAASSRLGLIAGEGELASCVAKKASALGMETIVVSLTDEIDPAVASLAAKLYRVDLADVLSIVPILKAERVTEAVMIGKVWRSEGFRRPRAAAAIEEVTRSRKSRTDVEVLHGFAERLEEAGITLVSQLRYLDDALPQEGIIGSRAPSPSQWQDIRFGIAVAKLATRAGIGQAVAVKDRLVVAVEAAEGTDAMIRRAGRIAPACVVVKASWPGGDERFDVPAVGPRTIETMAKARAGVLACEAGRTIIVRKRDTIAMADEAGIAMVGVSLMRGGKA